VALELVLAQTDKVAACVTRLGAYATGFGFDTLTMSAHGQDERELDLNLVDAGVAGAVGGIRVPRPSGAEEQSCLRLVRRGCSRSDARFGLVWTRLIDPRGDPRVLSRRCWLLLSAETESGPCGRQ
jgi:hypothetical protein